MTVFQSRRQLSGEVADLSATRLWLSGNLNDADKAALENACSDVRVFAAKKDLIKERAPVDTVHILLEGWACRYKITDAGARQIPALLVPGDICDIDAILLDRLYYGVATLTACKMAVVPRSKILELSARHPRIGATLWWLTMVENSILTEWTLCLGRRSAGQHMAHLLCELLVRLTAVGQAEANGYMFPLTQEQIGDVLGLTSVHVNRVLRSLREAGLVTIDGGRLTIRDWNRLKQQADFQTSYLRPEGVRYAPLAA